MRVQKFCVGADEFEFAPVQLLHAEVGEIFNLLILPRHDLLPIERNFPRAHSPRRGVFGKMFHLRRVEHRLRGHAAAQDAQPADLASAFDDHGFQTCRRRRARCRKPAAARANHRQVEIKFFHAREDGSARLKCNFEMPQRPTKSGWRESKNVASAILADVEPGFSTLRSQPATEDGQPGGTGQRTE